MSAWVWTVGLRTNGPNLRNPQVEMSIHRNYVVVLLAGYLPAFGPVAQSQAGPTMSLISLRLASQPRSSLARAGSATSMAGSPSRRGPYLTGTVLPETASTAEMISFTETPTPVPRLHRTEAPPAARW